ncbi:FadR/GntR family transcriptional regulator [Nonomuraea roseoviolacea]|uniref:DNA-binding FadR family transcriptional regulator n=1 Tax=Nonomuraea roseoviolacea subsp. carminata TaxID=160689 RepID=A0ABT1KFX5_9ACTN|nr:FadR/GntR family transcriptional regulator [Nonomuraea roseoviolacea]MCP2352554.1 DNA-binding FadR family transcriptional regulator [Nonomuraea roseoviolacea subsp. carminata]
MTSRTQRLVETLTARIREGVVRPGERLPTESSLVETYGVSRTVVREAISRLQAAGLVETHHGRGTFVLARPATARFPAGPQGEVTLEEVTGLLEFRTAFEVEAAALAARRRTDAHLAGLREALEAFADAADHPSAAVNADYRFHLRVALATGNHHFADLVSALGPSMIVVPRERLDPGGRFAGIVAEHQNIYAAIARGDADAARAAARVHLANSRARLLRPEPGDA